MNNEEKILQMLTTLVDTVNQQGETLARHEEMLVKQGEMLVMHGEMLVKQGETMARHEELLVKQGEMLARHEELLVKQGETLARHEELLVKQGETLDKQGETLGKHGGQLAEMKEDICELRETAVRVAITQENIVLPRLDTLADGHKHLLKTLASDSRVEALEEDVSTLKSAFKMMSNRLAALEKAQ